MAASKNAIVYKGAVWGEEDSGTPVLGKYIYTGRVEKSSPILTDHKKGPLGVPMPPLYIHLSLPHCYSVTEYCALSGLIHHAAN